MTHPTVVGPFAGDGTELPAMYEVRQRFDLLPAVDALAELDASWAGGAGRLAELAPGSSVAVAVGSRGIADIALVVREVVARLKAAGMAPFIVPAMGSHGGATAGGQTEVLAARGVTESSVGAPIRATMDVVSLGEADGIPLFLDRNAAAADGIVLVNRVKPHTDFVGPIESGLMKQLVIGLGKQTGADHYHRLGVVRGLEDTIPTAARALLQRVNVLFGVALVENEEHRTAALRVVPPGEIEQVEHELLELARRHLPGLPLDDVDLLIVDEMGKDISGNGLDPNVVGKAAAAYSVPRLRPRVSRIFVRDLTADTHGNAAGLGVTDAITTRLFGKIDAAATAMNAFTSCSPEDAKTPAVFACDRDAIVSLLTTVRPATASDLCVVHIRNTLDLARLWVSAGCLEQLPGPPAVTIDPTPRALVFDASGDLVSPLGG
ncbi:MAG TPA: lactate racemase domain-containing protein [Thermoleophilia bacterium]|nr:lactate racemase domain-containing protein [Thermoleophilia bacterium]